ncbi:hypothetical protein CD790_11720 [Streptomyces sp. SAJ15]|nr:hypothetical protein CD790_11720 [Streptomyces sp. SAJ15]
MWTRERFLWRTPLNLCTTRGTALWTTPHTPLRHGSDLRILLPRAVRKKNFLGQRKIATKGTEKIALRDGK